MTELAATTAHEGQMLGPRLGLHRTDDSRQAIEPPRLDACRRGQAQSHAVHENWNLRAERPQRAQRVPPSRDVVVGDHLHHVDRVQVRQDPGRQLGAPAQSDTVRATQSPPPPPQPPQPPPSPPPPHDEPQDVPQLDPLPDVARG